MLDQFDTPEPLAIAIAESFGGWHGGLAFDPTVGNGALLRAMRTVYGSGVVSAGADIDPNRIKSLSALEPNWILGRANGLLARSRASNMAWKAAREACEAVVFNPPFSFRGAGGAVVQVGNEQRIVSPALAFVLAAAELRPTRGMSGVIPAGALHNRRDKPAWEMLQRDYKVEVLRDLPRGSFVGIAASSLLIQLVPRLDFAPTAPSAGDPAKPASPPLEVRRCQCVEVFRGRARLRQPERWGGRNAILHTTDLADKGRLLLHVANALDDGPLVVLPRVGKPDPSKIVVVKGAATLSECLIGLRPRDTDLAHDIAGRLQESFEVLARAYVGTGAPHITLGRIKGYLQTLGLNPQDRGEIADCTCGAIFKVAA